MAENQTPDIPHPGQTLKCSNEGSFSFKGYVIDLISFVAVVFHCSD